jgi:hypothetical protein
MAFPGTAGLVDALAGGAGYEQDAYRRESARLTAARSQSALMDKRVADASTAQTKNTALTDLSQFFNPRDTAIAQSGTGSQISAIETAKGTAQENEARAKAMKIAEKLAAQLDIPQEDALNIMMSVASGKPITADHLGTSEQSGADLASTLAGTVETETDTSAAEAKAAADEKQALATLQKTQAGTGAANALTIKRNREGASGTGAAGNLLTGPFIEALSQPASRDVPNPDYDAEKFFSGDPTISEKYVPLREFQKWQAKMSGGDPSSPYYTNERFALSQWEASKDQAPAEPQAPAGTPGQTRQELYQSPADVQAALANGTLQPGDTFMTPEGPRTLK